MDRSIGIDIGGSNVRVAVYDREGKEQFYRIEPVAGSTPDALVSQIDGMLALCNTHAGKALPIGVAIPAPVNPQDGTHGLVFNVPALNQMDLCTELRRRHAVRVVADNDANAAALAQVRYGPRRGVRNLVYVTVSTSIGAGIICSGNLVHGAVGGAGEFGHISVAMDAELCYECKHNHGCLTTFASGTGLAWRAEQLRRTGMLPADSRLNRNGIGAADVAQAAEAGDPHAGQLLDQAARALGTAVLTLVHTLNPEVIAFGGSVIQKIEPLWEGLQRITHAGCMPQMADSFKLVRVPEGDRECVLGAAALVWEA